MTTASPARERLLQAARRLAQVKGFDRVSTSAILAEADVRRGSLYHFFPGKDALGLAVLERERVEFLALLDRTLGAPAAPEDALDRFFKAALRKHRQTGFVGGCLWGNTAQEMSDTNPSFARVVIDVFEIWIRRVAATIHAGQESGRFRVDMPARDLARLVVATLEGSIMLSRLAKRDAPMRSCLATLRGLLAPPAATRSPGSAAVAARSARGGAGDRQRTTKRNGRMRRT